MGKAVRVVVTCEGCGDTWPEYAYAREHIDTDRRQCSRWNEADGYCGGTLKISAGYPAVGRPDGHP